MTIHKSLEDECHYHINFTKEQTWHIEFRQCVWSDSPQVLEPEFKHVPTCSAMFTGISPNVFCRDIIPQA